MVKLSVLIGSVALAHSGFAALIHDQNASFEYINGSGTINGAFTVDRQTVQVGQTQTSIEVGLRAKVRYSLANNQPANVFNSNGDGTFSHAAGAPPANPDRARWNLEWSINTDTLGLSGIKVGDLTYEIGLDYNPGFGTSYEVFDPIQGPNPNFLPLSIVAWDHSFGNNSTANGQGVEAATEPQYVSYLSTYNLAQNSWNYAFYDNPPAFDPNSPGNYSIYFQAMQGNTVLARTEITVIVGGGAAALPEAGATLALLGLGAMGMAALRMRR